MDSAGPVAYAEKKGQGWWGWPPLLRKVAMMAVLKRRVVEASQKIVNQVKQRGNMTQATVNDCMERRGGGQGDV